MNAYTAVNPLFLPYQIFCRADFHKGGAGAKAKAAAHYGYQGIGGEMPLGQKGFYGVFQKHILAFVGVY